MNTIVVLTTCPTDDEARKIASGLIENRIAACVQMNAIQSVYRWQGAIESAAEVRLTIKGRAEDYSVIEHFIRKNSSYDTPQIIALPVSVGLEPYLDWLAAETDR